MSKPKSDSRTITDIYNIVVKNHDGGIELRFLGTNTNGTLSRVTVRLPYSYLFRHMLNQIKGAWNEERARRVTYINEVDSFTLKSL